jgi:uncharacterized protein YaiL (DUF2058 family)
MNPFAGAAFKVVGGGVAATLLSLGVAGGLAQAGSPSPSPTASSTSTKADARADHRAVVRAIFESEADVLGLKPEELRKDLKAGQKVSDLAKDRSMTKQQFADKLIANLRPRLEKLVDSKRITQAQADRVLDRISKGYIPFWDGIHRKK